MNHGLLISKDQTLKSHRTEYETLESRDQNGRRVPLKVTAQFRAEKKLTGYKLKHC